MGLQLNVTAGIVGEYTKTDAVGAVDDEIAVKAALSFVTGVGLGQANLLYTAAINIAASGSTTLTLSSLTDPLGTAIVMARAKAVLVIADAANVNDIVLGNAGSNPWAGPAGTTGLVKTRPGGVTLLAAHDATGWVVASGSADQLKIANSSSGSAVTGKIVILGADA